MMSVQILWIQWDLFIFSIKLSNVKFLDGLIALPTQRFYCIPNTIHIQQKKSSLSQEKLTFRTVTWQGWGKKSSGGTPKVAASAGGSQMCAFDGYSVASSLAAICPLEKWMHIWQIRGPLCWNVLYPNVYLDMKSICNTITNVSSTLFSAGKGSAFQFF